MKLSFGDCPDDLHDVLDEAKIDIFECGGLLELNKRERTSAAMSLRISLSYPTSSSWGDGEDA